MALEDRIRVLEVARREGERKPWKVRLELGQYEVTFIIWRGRFELLSKANKSSSVGVVNIPDAYMHCLRKRARAIFSE